MGMFLKISKTKYSPTCAKDHLLIKTTLANFKKKISCEYKTPAFRDHCLVFARVVFVDKFDIHEHVLTTKTDDR